MVTLIASHSALTSLVSPTQQDKKAAKKEQPKKEAPAKKKEEAPAPAEPALAMKPKDPLDALPAG